MSQNAPILDQDAYALLKRCSDAKDMTAWNEWRQKPENEGKLIYLQGAELIGGYYQGADFSGIHCEGTNFSFAHCKEADFFMTYCERAYFSSAHCKGAYFSGAHCEGTSFYSADFDGKSELIDCGFDENTDFRLTNLGAVKIEPGQRAFLERNIRRLNWEEWYKEIERPKRRQACRLIRRIWHPRFGGRWWRKKARVALLGRLTPKAQIVRLFWWISDYGYSTERILWTFLGCIGFFTCLYTFSPVNMLRIGDHPLIYSGFFDRIAHLPQMLFFAAATMVTLGFGNVNAAHDSLFGMFAVALNLMIGYGLLAVLVTRLAVLFQTMAPGYVPKKSADKTDSDEKKC